MLVQTQYAKVPETTRVKGCIPVTRIGNPDGTMGRIFSSMIVYRGVSCPVLPVRITVSDMLGSQVPD